LGKRGGNCFEPHRERFENALSASGTGKDEDRGFGGDH